MVHYVFRVLNNPFSVTTARNLRPKARESIRFGLNFPFYEGIRQSGENMVLLVRYLGNVQ